MDIRDVKENASSSGFNFLGVNKEKLVGVPVETLIETTKAFNDITKSISETNLKLNSNIEKVSSISDDLNNTNDSVEKINNNVSSISEKINRDKENLILKPFVCNYFAPFMMCGTEETSAQYMARSNMWVLDNSQIECTGEELERNLRIWNMAKKLNPDLKIFYYISIRSVHVENIPVYSRHEILQKFRDAIHIGAEKYIDIIDEDGFYTYEYGNWLRADGIFFDDVDFDDVSKDGGGIGLMEQGGWETKREKQNDLIDEAHKLGLCVMANDWYFMRSFDQTPTTDDSNYYENPKGLKYHLGENDFFMMESYSFSSNSCWTPVGDGWRYMDYKKKYYDTGIYKAKGVGMDYMMFEGITKNEVDIAYSFFIAEAITTGIPYLCILNGDYFVWDVPDIIKELSSNRLGEDAYYEKLGKGHFKVTANGHTLETIRALSLTESYVTRDISSVLACKIFYDGKRIINFFNSPGELEYNIQNKFEEYDKTISKIEENKQNTSSMRTQLLIDDDDPGRVLNIYTNYLKDLDLYVLGDGIAVEYIDDDNFIITASSGWKGGGYTINIDETNKDKYIGKTLEFGVLEYLCTFNVHWSIEIVTESNGLEYNIFNSINNGRTILDESVDANTHLYTQYTIPEDCTTIRFHLIQYSHNPISTDGTLKCSRPYIIDVSENEEKITKKWYTQFFPTSRNVYSAYDVEYTINKVYDEKTITFNATSTDPWGWSTYQFSEDELVNMRGHKFELGCSSSYVSGDKLLGVKYEAGTHISFGVGIDIPNPITCELYGDKTFVSEVYNDERPCVTFTIPENASIVCVGIQSYGLPSGTNVIINDLYLYDLNERKELSIRGEDPSKTYMTVSRVSADRFESDVNKKRLLSNALYIVDDGRFLATNSDKKIIEIAGAIYSGAVNAGYEGTPYQFGIDLYNLMNYVDNNI